MLLLIETLVQLWHAGKNSTWKSEFLVQNSKWLGDPGLLENLKSLGFSFLHHKLWLIILTHHNAVATLNRSVCENTFSNAV